jgi:hypothetical protein
MVANDHHAYASNCVEDDWGNLVCSDSGSTTPPPAGPGAPTVTPKVVGIDTGQTLQSKAGDGVGLFVEYAAGGHWHLWTTCDTATSNLACAWEVYATPDTNSSISNARGESLESNDVVEMSGASVHFVASTAMGTQGVTFDANAGATVRLEVMLDGALEPRYVYWVDKGVLHAGAPTDPVDFSPSAP